MLVFLVSGTREILRVNHYLKESWPLKKGGEREVHVIHESYGNNFGRFILPLSLTAVVLSIIRERKNI
jgi:hypothetical protein